MPPATPEHQTPPARDTKRWPRDVWFDAIWECGTLKPNERVVAYCFARYAGSGNITWCPVNELRRRTGIRSRNGIWLATKGLIDTGWLWEVEKARQHFSARYKIVIPIFQTPPRGTSEFSTGPPDVPLGDIPDVPEMNPDVPEMNPDVPQGVTISQTHYSNTSLRPGGHAAPRTPLRQDDPSGRLNETDTSPTEVVTNKSNLATQPTTRAHAKNVIDFPERNKQPRTECQKCKTSLEPDGSCFTCQSLSTATTPEEAS